MTVAAQNLLNYYYYCFRFNRRAGVSIGIPQGSALGPSLSELIILYRLEKEGEIKAGIPLGSILGPLFCFSGRVKNEMINMGVPQGPVLGPLLSRLKLVMLQGPI